MADDPITQQIRERLGASFDSDLVALLANPTTRLALRVLAGSSVDRMVEVLAKHDDSLTNTARAIPVMARSGWAPSSEMPPDAVEVAAAAGPKQLDEKAEVAIEEAWASSGLFDRLGPRIKTLGAADDELRRLASERSRLISIAWSHHARGEYAASIPIVLAQIDGIVHDATTSPDRPRGLSLFAKGKKVDNAVSDDATLAGMNEALPTARDWFFDEAVTTSIHGSINRNAVLHGRELAYDTRRNSTKAFVLLSAVWEWANGALAEMADSRKDARYREYAGSDENDENGWRLDRRGFVETRLLLRNLGLAQHTYRTHHGTAASLIELASDDLSRSLLMGADLSQAELHIEIDGRWWAHCRSESGWAFAIGGLPGPDFQPYYFDGAEPPTSPPTAAGWRRIDDGNWSGDCYW